MVTHADLKRTVMKEEVYTYRSPHRATRSGSRNERKAQAMTASTIVSVRKAKAIREKCKDKKAKQI